MASRVRSIAYVEWLDSSVSAETMALSELNQMTGERLYTAGMLVSEDEEVVRIAQDLYEGGRLCRTTLVIPRFAIERMDKLEVPVSPLGGAA